MSYVQLLQLWFTSYSARYSKYRVSLMVGAYLWVISFGLYTLQFFPADNRVADLAKLCAWPLARDLAEPILAYRLLVPLLAWILHLPFWGVIALQYIALILTLGLVYHAVASRACPWFGLLVTAGLSLTHLTQWTNNCPGVPDSVTHLLSACCLLTVNPLLTTVLAFAATLNDERFLLSAPFIVGWHSGLFCTGGNTRNAVKVGMAIALGLVGVAVVRRCLASGCVGAGIPEPDVYTHMGTVARSMWGFAQGKLGWLLTNYFMGFRWVWALPMAFLLYAKHPWQSKTVFSGLILSVLAASTVVWDVSRSIAFAFPMVLLAALALYEANPKLATRITLVACLLCSFTPAFYLAPGGLQLYLPLPLVALRLWTGWDVVDLVRPPTGTGRFGVH